jgi:dolichol kinase
VYENLLDLVKAFLQYGGFAAVFAGVTMWFMSDKDSRAQYGIWLMVGGLLMIVFFFANSAIIQLLKGIANGF